MRAQIAPAMLLPERGVASWYGGSFNGQRAANGEVFDEEKLTAAHRTLPFGTKVRVRLMGSAASVVVRITDRGPFVDSRIIDLSYAAAKLLGMTQPGLAPVTIEMADDNRSEVPVVTAAGPTFVVQAGAFRSLDNAHRTQKRMAEKFGEAHVVATPAGLWCVLVGRAASQAEAQAIMREVRNSDAAFQSAYVTKVDSAALVSVP